MSRRTAVIVALSMVAASGAAVVGSRLLLGQPHPTPLRIESTGNDSPFAYTALVALAMVGRSRRTTWLLIPADSHRLSRTPGAKSSASWPIESGVWNPR